jgi:hypothetical protein
MIKTKFSEKISFIMFKNNEVKVIGVKSRFMIWNMEMYKMENIKQAYNHWFGQLKNDEINWLSTKEFYEIEQHYQINKNEE